MNSQFAIFRFLFGSYLTWHFIALLPYGTELFSNEGVMKDPSLNPTFGIFPNPLYLWDSPRAIMCFLIIATIGSITFSLGILRRTSAIVLWFLISAFFHRNNLTSNPSLPYLGLILALSVFIPPGEKFSLAKKNPHWQMPTLVIPVATFLLAIGYTFSGWTKLSSPSWVDGSAIRRVLENPLARPGFFRDFLLNIPEGLLSTATWAALLAELLYLPLALHRKLRPLIWLALIMMHLALILLIDFADLSLGMLMIHLFTFDPKWLPAKGRVRLAFDADCLMCNRFLSFLANEDHKQQLTFQALPEGKKTTMLAFRDHHTYQRSTAVIVTMEALGGHWRGMALIARIAPRPLRDLVYCLVARNRHRFSRKTICQLPSTAVKSRLIELTVVCLLVSMLSSCSDQPLHQGRFPFCLMDRPPGGNHLQQKEAAFREVIRHELNEPVPTKEIRVGDVIAFHMSHREAMSHLRKKKIQKIPYDLFAYGHLALVVDQGQGPRLLQIAMKQAAHIDDGFDYLSNKQWILYRPTRQINEQRLASFVNRALLNASNAKKAYDYTGALGIKNVTTTPNTLEEIPDKFTCVTLIQAALHYSGHPTRCVHRKGILDIVTPAQVIYSSVAPLEKAR